MSFFSSEHYNLVLNVSYCDPSMSVVGLAPCRCPSSTIKNLVLMATPPVRIGQFLQDFKGIFPGCLSKKAKTKLIH